MKKLFLLFFAGWLLILLPSSVLAASTATVGASADPAKNILCWTEKACETDWDKDTKNDGVFDGGTNSSPESLKTCGGGNYGYCYPYQEPYNLSVSLPIGKSGITTTVLDLGDYINKMYVFLLSISGIVAILMIMVGGVQYILARGGTEAGKAKDRIKNAITGVALLFFANIILWTVNPQLIKLVVPQIPKARTVFFISDGTSCESLLAQNTDPNHPVYKLKENPSKPGLGDCGDPMPEIIEINGQAPAEKKYCSWSRCTGSPPAVCFDKTLGGKSNACLNCNNIYDGNPWGIEATSESCSRLSAVDEKNIGGTNDGKLKIKQECFKTNDTSLDLTGTSCALVTMDCSSIYTCHSYEDISVVSNGKTKKLSFIQNGFGSDSGLENFCNDDLCGWHRSDQNQKCKFSSFTGTRAVASTFGVAGLIVAATVSDVCYSIDPATGVVW